MSIALSLPNGKGMQAEEYVKEKLIPLAGELNRLVQEFFIDGNSTDDNSSDLTIAEPSKRYINVGTRLVDTPKKTSFHIPSEFPSINNDKQLKVVFLAVLYNTEKTSSAFRLVNSSDGEEIEDSIIQIFGDKPTLYQRYLRVGDRPGLIRRHLSDYHIEARLLAAKCKPVCRRFSLNLTYV